MDRVEKRNSCYRHTGNEGCKKLLLACADNGLTADPDATLNEKPKTKGERAPDVESDNQRPGGAPETRQSTAKTRIGTRRASGVSRAASGAQRILRHESGGSSRSAGSTPGYLLEPLRGGFFTWAEMGVMFKSSRRTPSHRLSKVLKLMPMRGAVQVPEADTRRRKPLIFVWHT